MSIGERVREIRTKRGLSQADLGRQAGMHQPVISEIESGRSVTSRTMERLADALGVSVGALFEDEAPPRVPPPPQTPLTSSTPEELETKLYGAPEALEQGEAGRSQEQLRPVLSEPEARGLSDALRTELDLLEDWIEAYLEAPTDERFERRSDYERARGLRKMARLYHDWAFDGWSKLYDPRPAPFKSVMQFAGEQAEAQTLFLSALQGESERERVQRSGEAG
jgi:transcriptional regulator with XRE-family HTH domain